jgi:Skp family chaperone for outer membrane proteins
MIELHPTAMHNVTQEEAVRLGVDTVENVLRQYDTEYIKKLEDKLLTEIASHQADLETIQAELQRRTDET